MKPFLSPQGRALRTIGAAGMLAVFAVAAQAKVVMTNESKNTNVWTLPSGTNLLAASVPSGSAVTHEGSSSAWTTLTNGSVGSASPETSTSVTPNNTNEVVFPLDVTAKPAGYDITSFDSYCAWANSGRDNQNYTLQYSTVAAPTTWITIGAVDNRTSLDISTHTRLTNDNGYLATGVHSIKIIFGNNQENGYTGFREFVLQDTPVTACVMTDANNDNNFFIPGGTNLLAGLTPAESTPAQHEGSSATWGTVTDGSLGNHTLTTSSVTPNNGDTLTYPLDLTSHPYGRDLYAFDSFCAWGSNGRDDQNYVLSYSTVTAPTTFIPIATVAAHTEYNGANTRRATHARVTANGGLLATGVHSIRLTFQSQENGYTGFREFFLSEAPMRQTTYESNQTNNWTLPVGINLLAGATAVDPSAPAGTNHGNGDVTSSSWSTLADGSVGSAGTQLQSVAPGNQTSLVYTLDTTVNSMGYNLTSFDAYAAWGDTGRDNQDFTMLYSTVADPATFIPIEVVANHTNYPVNATHTRVLPASGYLATNVGAVKFVFDNQENGYVGYREFIVRGTAVSLFSPLTWTGLDGASGYASWVTTPDNNWSDGVASTPFNSLAPLSFDDSGINTTINLPVALTADSLTFHNNSMPYVFGGETLTVSNSVALQGAGSVNVANTLAAAGVEVSGTGTLTLSSSNNLTGSSTVNNGALIVAHNQAMGTSALAMTGGEARFTSASPVLSGLSGTGGTVILGNPAGGGSGTTLNVGDATTTIFAGSITDASATAPGSLRKTGAGTLVLTGLNSYTGTTTVNQGVLSLGQRNSLYNGDTFSWTASRILVSSDLTLRMGGVGEFTGADVAALDTGGFNAGAVLGLDTSSGDTVIAESLGGGVSLEKKGLNALTLSGSNTFAGAVAVDQGALYAANLSGVSIPGDLVVGNVTFDVWANMVHDNQFGPASVIKFSTGAGAVNGKVQLRGTNQTVAGLESHLIDRVALVQNDETTAPGYTANPGPCTLTIDTPEGGFHSFHGIIRNQDGGVVSVVKKGLGTQELINTTAQGYGYSGPTTVEAGTLRINFAQTNTGFASNIEVQAPATLAFNSDNVVYYFDRVISGAGQVVVTGAMPVAFRNGSNSWSGGTTVDGGFLALDTSTATGDGNGPGQTCVGGAMDPSNVIRVIHGGTLSLDHTAALGNSPVLPQYAPSVEIGEGCRIWGGVGTVAFVSNLTLDGGHIEITGGANTGGFGTNLALVGTVIVGGSSSVPSSIFTNADFLSGGATPSAYANASLGSIGLPGTVFRVADVTGDAAADLVVSTALRDVLNVASPLTKTGPGTMSLTGANSFTGDTTVQEGTLMVAGSAIMDSNKLVLDGGKLDLVSDETVGTLFFGGVQQVAGTYGSTSSMATHQDDTRFSGSAVLIVTTGPVTDPYLLWAAQIADENQRDKTDDPDGDGFSNLEEFLFGTSPVAANGSLIEMESTGSGLVVRWNQRAAGTSIYVLQESTTLLDDPWPASTAPVTDNPVQDLPDYVRKEATVPVDVARKFVRVSATE